MDIKDVDSILNELDKYGDIKKARIAIADLIDHHLHALQNSLGYWEKTHFANAIACLAWNIGSRHQPSIAWLRLCIVNIKKALVSAEQRNENYTPQDKQIEALSYEEFIEDVKLLRQRGYK
ncbi:MAG: hypothetical protein ACYDG4_16590 [Desulfuromonadaceae bacterium]